MVFKSSTISFPHMLQPCLLLLKYVILVWSLPLPCPTPFPPSHTVLWPKKSSSLHNPNPYQLFRAQVCLPNVSGSLGSIAMLYARSGPHLSSPPYHGPMLSPSTLSYATNPFLMLPGVHYHSTILQAWGCPFQILTVNLHLPPQPWATLF